MIKCLIQFLSNWGLSLELSYFVQNKILQKYGKKGANSSQTLHHLSPKVVILSSGKGQYHCADPLLCWLYSEISLQMDSLCSGDSVRIHQTSSDYDGSRSGSGSHTGAAAALTRSLAQPTVPPTWQQDIDTDSLIHRSLPYVAVLMCFNSSAWISCDHTCFSPPLLAFIYYSY